MNDQDKFDLFSKRIRCAVNRMKLRNLRFVTNYYCLTSFVPVGAKQNNRVWGGRLSGNAHPIDILIEGRPAKAGDKSKRILETACKYLHCERSNLLAFNYGLKGATQRHNYTDIQTTYYNFGRTIRQENRGR